jgi:hypothetical protein
MKKIKKGKLALDRVTLKPLETVSLETVVGGMGEEGGPGAGGQEAAAFSRQGTCWSCASCIACV